MSKHTPGPWDLFPSVEDKPHCVGTLYGSLVREVASVHELSDARLIAAAPAMLKALEQAAFVLRAECEGDERFAVEDTIASVIRAARGQS